MRRNFSFIIVLFCFLSIGMMANNHAVAAQEQEIKNPNNTSESDSDAQAQAPTTDSAKGTYFAWRKIGAAAFHALANFGEYLSKEVALTRLCKGTYAQELEESREYIKEVMLPGLPASTFDTLVRDIKSCNAEAFEMGSAEYKAEFPGAVYRDKKTGKVFVTRGTVKLLDDRLLTLPGQSAPALVWIGPEFKKDGLVSRPRMFIILWCGNPTFKSWETNAEATVTVYSQPSLENVYASRPLELETIPVPLDERADMAIAHAPEHEDEVGVIPILFFARTEGNFMSLPKGDDKLNVFSKDTFGTVQKTVLGMQSDIPFASIGASFTLVAEGGARSNRTDAVSQKIQPEFHLRAVARKDLGRDFTLNASADFVKVFGDEGEQTTDFAVGLDQRYAFAKIGILKSHQHNMGLKATYQQNPHIRAGFNLKNIYVDATGVRWDKQARLWDVLAGVELLLDEEYILGTNKSVTQPNPATIFLGVGHDLLGGYLYAELLFEERKFSTYVLPEDRLVAVDNIPSARFGITWIRYFGSIPVVKYHKKHHTTNKRR